MDNHFLFYHIKGTQSRGYFVGMIYGPNGVLFLTRISDHKKSFPLCCSNEQYNSMNKKITVSEAKNIINMCYNSARIEAKGIP